ncbi:EF-hand domain-containing protein, partial [Salmonella sp. s54925]|uniref:EF-hand domain-containing protein n=1 Tax=Salmonella sp. s54925 TaxID=3159674 RepID=UPI0039803D12
WEEDDGIEKEQFNPKTFFRLHDNNGDGYLDPMELETLFVREASKIHNKSDPDFDARALDEEVQRMREHVVKQVDSDRDNFVSYDEFVGATNDKEYEKPDEGWKGIDDEKEFTDDEFAQYEKEFADEDDEEEEEDGEN